MGWVDFTPKLALPKELPIYYSFLDNFLKKKKIVMQFFFKVFVSFETPCRCVISFRFVSFRFVNYSKPYFAD